MVPERRRVRFWAGKKMEERVSNDATPGRGKDGMPGATGSDSQR